MTPRHENGITIPAWVFRSPVFWVFVLGGLSALGYGGFGIANGTAQASELQIKVARNTEAMQGVREDIKEIKEMLRDLHRISR